MSVTSLFPRNEQALMPAAQEDVWATLPEASRRKATQRAQIVRAIEQMCQQGCSGRTAIEHLLLRIEQGQAPQHLTELALTLGRAGKTVSNKTLERWLADYRKHGITGLVPQHKGSARKTRGWEVRAMHLFQRPTKPAMSTVAGWLREEGWESATDDRVRSYLKSLPTHESSSAPSRVGRHYYNQNMRPYVVRDNSVIPVGFLYQGDGHCCDVYVEHPATGKHWRPELTAWMDVTSHYIPGWWLSEAESAVSTLYALSWALVSQDHVPAAIHTDPGSGFKNRMMDDEVTGYLNRLSIEPIVAIPGNAKGKGNIEGWFNVFEERCGKKFDSYCGHCRTDDALSRFETKVRRGEIRVPTLDEYKDEIARFIDRYNNTPQKALGNKAPAELWQGLEQVPLELPAEAIVRPHERRKVRRWGVTLYNRLYRHEVLQGFDGHEVAVEYDLHDASFVIIRDLEGRYLCDARLVEARPGLAPNRIDDLQNKRIAGQVARAERKIEEMQRRTLQQHDQTADIVSTLTSPDIEHVIETGEDATHEHFDIDLTTTDY